MSPWYILPLLGRTPRCDYLVASVPSQYYTRGMKAFLIGLLFLSLVSVCDAAVSLQQVVKLSKLKTSDDVIIQLIQKEGLEKPITSRDVVYLKEQGVSDRVIAYLMKISAEKPEGKSTYLSKNLRTYYTTTKDGKKVKVVTNLDENGKRIGGALPPEERMEPEPAYQTSEPKEVYVIVRTEEPQQRRDYEVEYAPPIPARGIPLYNTYYPSYPTPYFPYYPYSTFYKHRPPSSRPPSGESTVTTEGLRNLVRPRQVQTPRSVPGSSAGTRSVKR